MATHAMAWPRNALRFYHLCDCRIFADSGAQLDGSEGIRGRAARGVGACVVVRSDHDCEFLAMAAGSHGSGRPKLFAVAGRTRRGSPCAATESINAAFGRSRVVVLHQPPVS